MKKNLLPFFILIVFSIPSIMSLFHKGFFQSDDGEWMIIRFSAFHEVLRSGEFPVRFLTALNYGYGYPVANFLYPGFMYLAEFPKVLGFGFVDSIKIVLGLSMMSSAIFVYLWLSKLFGKLESLIGGIFYLYAPYHLYDLYKRGSVGELLALAVVPFIFWQIERKSFFWATMGIGSLILSHNTLAVLFLPLIIIYMLLNIFIERKGKRTSNLYFLIFTVFLGLGIAAFFWIPALVDLKYTVFAKTPISNLNNYFVNWELIGLSTVFIFTLSSILFLTKKIVISKHRLTLLLFIVGLLSLFFSLQVSEILWKFLPVSFIQFPFRFLSLTILCASFLSAVAVSVLPKNLKIVTTAITLLLLIFSARQFIVPSAFFDKGDFFYSTNQDTTTVKNEYMPIWVKSSPLPSQIAKVENLNGQEKINLLEVTPKKILFKTFLPTQRKIQVNIVNFPGWTAYINKRQADIEYDNPKGVITLKLDKGQNNVLVAFKETPLRLFSDIVSLLSFCLLALVTVRYRGSFNFD